jgi:hypothetical protein
MKLFSKPYAAVLLLAICIGLPGFSCSNFERVSFQALSSSKGVIDQAAADYNSKAIAQSQVNYNLINKARSGQAVAVDALAGYHNALNAVSKDQTVIANAKAAVDAALASLTQVLVDVKSADPNAAKAPPTLSTQQVTLTPPATP